MYCPKCGEHLDDNARFCKACGAMISGDGSRVDFSAPAVVGYAEPVDASRSLFTWIVLTILTCGIYSWYFIYKLAVDMNRMCSGDGEETPGLLVFVLLSMVTCGFYAYWWYYKIGNRMQANAPRYGLNFQENGTTILLWQIVGILLCGLGPFVAMHIIIKNANALATAYNLHLVRA